MKKLFWILLIVSLTGATAVGQNFKSQMLFEASSGISKLHKTDVSSQYYRIDYAGLVPGSKFNWGLKYFAGVSTPGSTTYQEYDYYDYDYLLGTKLETTELSVWYVHYGMGLLGNKYLLGNYFDGGLYTTAELSVDLTHVRGNRSTLSSEYVLDTTVNYESYDYLEAMDMIMLNGGITVGYTIPLSNCNLGAFVRFEHTIWGKDFFSDLLTVQEYKISRMIISAGINIQLFRSYRYLN